MARRQGQPRNLGGLLSPSEELGTAVRGKRASAGTGEFGVPQYERRSGGTDPRGPAEQRAAPGGVGTTRRNEGRDTELTNHLNETRAGSRTGEDDEGEAPDDAGPSHRCGLAARGIPEDAEGRSHGR